MPGFVLGVVTGLVIGSGEFTGSVLGCGIGVDGGMGVTVIGFIPGTVTIPGAALSGGTVTGAVTGLNVGVVTGLVTGVVGKVVVGG